MTHSRQAGFTLVEITIVVAILTIMLAAVWNASDMVTSTVTANSRSAEVTGAARGTLRKIGAFVRPGKMSTITVQAVQADVTAGLATSVGEWIFPTDLVWRPGIRFQSAAGLLSMNAALSTLPRSLTSQLEPGETQNGVDDDGDGLVDEGEVMLLHNSVTVAVVRHIEECSYMLDGRMLRVRVRCGRSDMKGTVYRAHLEQSFYLRNN